MKDIREAFCAARIGIPETLAIIIALFLGSRHQLRNFGRYRVLERRSLWNGSGMATFTLCTIGVVGLVIVRFIGTRQTSLLLLHKWIRMRRLLIPNFAFAVLSVSMVAVHNRVRNIRVQYPGQDRNATSTHKETCNHDQGGIFRCQSTFD